MFQESESLLRLFALPLLAVRVIRRGLVSTTHMLLLSRHAFIASVKAAR
jgi:hypothetical protein